MTVYRHPLVITFATIFFPAVMQLVYIRYASYHIEKSILGDFVLLQMLVVALSYIFLQVPVLSFKIFYNAALDKNEFINEFKTLLLFINLLCLIFVALYGLVFPRFDSITLCLLVIYFWLLSGFSLGQQVFLLRLERGRYFGLKFIEAFAKFILPLIIFNAYKSLESLLAGLVIGYGAANLIARFYEKEKKFKYVFKSKNLLKYFHFSYPMLFVSFFSWGITFSDRYFIDYFMSSYDVGVYAILSTVAGLGTVFGQVYSTYVNPKVLKTYEENRNQSLRYLKNSLLMLAIMFVFMCLVAFALPELIWTLLIEPDVINNKMYAVTFYMLIISVCLSVFQIALSMYFNLFKKLNVLIGVYAIAFAVNLIGNLFIAEHGVFAAALSTVVAYLIILVLQLIYVMRLYKQYLV